MYDKTVRRRRAALALLVGLSLILLTASFGESAGAIQRGALEVLAPIQEGASRALKPVRDLLGWFGDTLDAKGERDALRRERDALRREVIRNANAARENVELRKLVGLDEQAGLAELEPVGARVIGRSPTVWYATLTVNKGSSDGVRVDQPVVTGGGATGSLVGKVTEVTSGSAQVTLITDHTSGVSAKISETGDPGFARPDVGDPNDLLLDYLPRTSRVRRGDRVVTSGTRGDSRLESLFPPGIPIGEVTRVDPEELDLDQRVHIKPYADLRRLEFVQVLTRRASGARAQLP